MIKVIGIDPGLSSTGVGIVRGKGIRIDGFSFGSVNTVKDLPLACRLNKIYTKILSLLENEEPDLLIIEDIFSLQEYPKSGIVLGQVSGVILLAAEQIGITAREVSVREAKQVLTGNGNASKIQLEKSVRYQLKLTSPIRPLHASDALGLALIGLYRHCR
jgi:crossover junction endodeoxyribonuclease RuvC